ncbi:MAG: formylmethanofuran dehydrogenase subunit B [Candidatus Freyarchaeota archaeon]|nr:formylmethanofuran dehydrogenase subunit B [Candidatus Freyrarchaeum guaymaensis]
MAWLKVKTVCTGCSLLCDDVIVEVEDGKITSTFNLCGHGEEKFLKAKSEERLLKPFIRDGGKREATIDEAIEKAAEILLNAERPVLWGWSSSSVEAQLLGIELAREVRGVIDGTGSICHSATWIAGSESGFPTATLGEVLNKADVIVYWGSDPGHSHPRHLSRYSVLPRGAYTQSGYEQRQVYVFDIRKTRVGKVANFLVEVEPNRDYELISAMRLLLKGKDVRSDKIAGVPLKTLRRIIDEWKSRDFGAVFYGMGLLASKGKYRNLAALIKLVWELNEYTRFVVLPMAGHYNMIGFNHVATQTVGFPFGIDFSRGAPYSNPGETTFAEMLGRGEFDAALIIGSNPVFSFPIELVRKLVRKPLIVIDCFRTATVEHAQVAIPAAITGIEAGGIAYRMDSIPIILKDFLKPPEGVLSDAEIIKLLLEKVRSGS